MPILQQKHFVRVVLCPTSQWLKMLQTHQLPFALSLFGLDQHCPIHFHIVDNVLPDLQAPKQCMLCFFSNASVSFMMLSCLPSSHHLKHAWGRSAPFQQTACTTRIWPALARAKARASSILSLEQSLCNENSCIQTILVTRNLQEDNIVWFVDTTISHDMF